MKKIIFMCGITFSLIFGGSLVSSTTVIDSSPIASPSISQTVTENNHPMFWADIGRLLGAPQHKLIYGNNSSQNMEYDYKDMKVSFDF